MRTRSRTAFVFCTVVSLQVSLTLSSSRGRDGLQSVEDAVIVEQRTGTELPLANVDPSTTINHYVEAWWRTRDIQSSPTCSDEAFVRRVYLDLVGRIPTTREAVAFLDDHQSDKRERLVNALLASPAYAQHMSDVFNVALMGRGGENAASQREKNGWLDYLAAAFGENRPWNQIVRELLLARPTGPDDAGAVWFLFERDSKPQEIAEAVAANLFGIQIQCAQCHDHMSAFEIEQRHYWGLVAFFNRGKNVRTEVGPRVAESAVGGFASFTDLSGKASDARLTFLGTDHVIEEERPLDGQEQEDRDELYVTHNEAGDPLEPRIPRFSRRQAFVDEIMADSPLIARAFVNRMWALLMGRGLVHPVDKMDSMHDPSHPELLDWLAADFEKSGYDVKRLVRSIVHSRPYQLDGRPTGSAADESTFAWALSKPLSAEAYYRSMLIAVDGSLENENADAMAAFRDVFPDLFAEENVANYKQSLFLANHDVMQGICQVRPEGTLQQMLACDRLEGRVQSAYRAAFLRDPDDEELAMCATYLQERNGDPESAASQLMWALLTSAEFRFNH